MDYIIEIFICEYKFRNFFRFFIAFFAEIQYNSSRQHKWRKIIMRKNIYANNNSKYKIIAVDDEIGVLDSLNVFLSKSRL